MAAGVAIALTLWMLRDTVSGLELVGYPGVLVLSLLGSGGVPLPALVAVCGLSPALSPLFVGILSGVGEAAGEMTGYAIGYGARGALERRAFYRRIRGWMERRGTLVLFLVSVIPNPFFDVIGIAAGSTRYPLRRFLVTVWAGKTLKGLMVAYACSYGWTLLPWVG